MIISAEKMLLLVRYNEYRHTDFISEHTMLLNENGYVWMLKLGKRIPDEKIKRIQSETGQILLRAPKAIGGQVFLTTFDKCFYGEPTPNMDFPDYYYSMIDDEQLWQVNSLKGNWFRITSITQVQPFILNKLHLISNDGIVADVISKTMSSTMYVVSHLDLEA